MENKVCKKCHRPLPEDYKFDECEACRNKQVQVIKEVAKKGAVLVAVVPCITKFVGKVVKKIMDS